MLYFLRRNIYEGAETEGAQEPTRRVPMLGIQREPGLQKRQIQNEMNHRRPEAAVREINQEEHGRKQQENRHMLRVKPKHLVGRGQSVQLNGSVQSISLVCVRAKTL